MAEFRYVEPFPVGEGRDALPLVEYLELGMEAVYRLEVEDFPAVILVDDKGNDFFQALA